jgi:outer membrane protein OmpA-like peptidoglycan-associated protein
MPLLEQSDEARLEAGLPGRRLSASGSPRPGAIVQADCGRAQGRAVSVEGSLVLGKHMVRIAVIAALTLLVACASRPTEPRTFAVFFESDKASLTPDAQRLIAEMAAAAHASNPSKIVVEGHADGSTAHDASLADERASVVIHGLVDAGVDGKSIDKQPSAPAGGATGVAAHQVIVRFLP